MFASNIFHATQFQNFQYEPSVLFKLASYGLLPTSDILPLLLINVILFRLQWRFNYPPSPVKPSWTGLYPKGSHFWFISFRPVANQYATLLNFYLTSFKGRPHMEKKYCITERRWGEKPHSLNILCWLATLFISYLNIKSCILIVKIRKMKIHLSKSWKKEKFLKKIGFLSFPYMVDCHKA